jgi:hypothetical protein
MFTDEFIFVSPPSPMTSSSKNGYTIEIRQVKGLGAPWIVRVFKKRFPFRKVISSDWFLNQQQAERFAEELRTGPMDANAANEVAGRAPGWTLHRAPR